MVGRSATQVKERKPDTRYRTIRVNGSSVPTIAREEPRPALPERLLCELQFELILGDWKACVGILDTDSCYFCDLPRVAAR